MLVCVLAFAGLSLASAQASAEPIVTTEPVTDVSYASALAHGVVDPNGEEVFYFFQYTTSPEEGLWILGPQYLGRTLPADAGPTKVSELLKGENEYGGIPFNVALEGNTKYYVRLIAASTTCCGIPSSFSSPPYPTFTTLPIEPPTVKSAIASNLGNRSVDVSGVVDRPDNPDFGFNSQCKFEYLTDAQYGPRNEKQRLTVQASGGTYMIGYAAKPGTIPKYSVPLAYNAPKATVQAAIEGLAAIGPGNVTVTGGPGSPSGGFPYTVNFTGALANKNVEYLQTDGTNLTGEVVQAFSTTVVEGHPEGFEQSNQVPCSIDPITEPGDHAVNAQITGLAPNTTYHFALTAKNWGGKDIEPIGVLTTTSVPAAETLRAGTIKDTSAVLGGRVNPENAPLSYQFEWGSDDTYGNVLPATPVALETIGEFPQVVTEPLTGLEPLATYHFRVAATNTKSGQTTYGDDETFKTLQTPAAPGACANEEWRVGFSKGLPDCRIYEFASPDMNFAAIYGQAAVTADGNTVQWQAADSPLDAESNEALVNIGTSTRLATGVWKTKSFNPPIPVQSSGYANIGVPITFNEGMTEAVVTSKFPIAGPGSPTGGVNYYLRRPDNTFVPLTNTGASPYAFGGGCGCVASRDFTHIYYTSDAKQIPEDPSNGNAYEWTDGEIRLVGYLPGDTTPAPNGAVVPFPQNGKGSMISADGSHVVFKANGFNGLYVRVNGEETEEASASEVGADLNPSPDVKAMGISDDGSKVVFTSNSELAEGSYTGRTEGAPNYSGRDLYVYDTVTGDLTDLTVDTKPADAATGADVRFVIGHTEDFSTIYFLAKGSLAPGGPSGEESLYVWRNGEIDYVGPAPGGAPEGGYGFYTTPSGQHAIFGSSRVLTSYDNTNPTNGEPMPMVYKYTYKGAIECVSCRPSGERPTAGAGFSVSRPMSDDGKRVFFESGDSVLPQATAKANVFEYEAGEVKLISPANVDEVSHLYGASATGDDVFFQSFGEITPDNQGEIMGIYTARVGGTRAPTPPPSCQGETCRESPTAPPDTPSPGTSSFSASVRVSVSESKVRRGKTAQLRVIVPEAGELTVEGKGLKPVKKQVSKAGSVSLTVTLTPGKNKRRLSKGVFNTRAEVIFASAAGDTSRDDVPLKFKAPLKGGK